MSGETLKLPSIPRKRVFLVWVITFGRTLKTPESSGLGQTPVTAQVSTGPSSGTSESDEWWFGSLLLTVNESWVLRPVTCIIRDV